MSSAYEAWARNGDPAAGVKDRARRDALTAEHVEHRERVAHALRCPRPLTADADLAVALAWVEATFPKATFALTGQPLADWAAIPTSRADDPRPAVSPTRKRRGRVFVRSRSGVLGSIAQRISRRQPLDAPQDRRA